MKRIDCQDKPKAGFTLIELLIVIAIITILAAILFPVFASAREKSRQGACLSNEKQLGLALLQYAQDYDEGLPMRLFGSYPDQWQWCDATYPYVKSVGVFACPSMANTGTVGPVIGTSWNATTQMTQLKIDSTHNLSYGINDSYFNAAADSSYHVQVNAPFGNNGKPVYMSTVQLPDQTILMMDYISNGTGFGAGFGVSTDVTTSTSANYAQVYRHTGLTNVLLCDGHTKTMSQSTLCTTHNVAWTSGGVGTDAVYYLFTVQND